MSDVTKSTGGLYMLVRRDDREPGDVYIELQSPRVAITVSVVGDET
jgi:hypothetical protein